MNKPKIIVFGTTGTVGSAICDEAKNQGYEIIGIGRSKNENCIESFQLDFKDIMHLNENINKIDPINLKGIIFCHRARTIVEEKRKSLFEALEIELNPIYAIKDYLENINLKDAINIVTITSTAGNKINLDINYNYHVVKGSALCAGLSLALLKTNKCIFSNALCIGEIKNTRIKEHSKHKKAIFSALESIITTKNIVSTKDIAKQSLELCNANKYNLNGQIISLDGGLGNISQDSIVRSLIK